MGYDDGRGAELGGMTTVVARSDDPRFVAAGTNRSHLESPDLIEFSQPAKDKTSTSREPIADPAH